MKTILKIRLLVCFSLFISGVLSAQPNPITTDANVYMVTTSDQQLLASNDPPLSRSEPLERLETNPVHSNSSLKSNADVAIEKSLTLSDAGAYGVIVVNNELIDMYKRYMAKPGLIVYTNYAINFSELNYSDMNGMRKAFNVYLGLDAPDSAMLASNQIINLDEQKSTIAITFPLRLHVDEAQTPIMIAAERKKIGEDISADAKLPKSAKKRDSEKLIWFQK